MKSYETLKLTDNFIFSKVMQDEHLCKQLLEVILDIEIDHIIYCETQKELLASPDAKSVRLDAYVKDEVQTVYNIEMQATLFPNLPKRSRYYQSIIDINLLEKGTDYINLNRSYVIFICIQDPFNAGRHIYTFENICKEDPYIHLNDDAIKIFLNANSQMDDVSEELSCFLSYLTTGTPTDDFTSNLETAVSIARNNPKWREEYMTLEVFLQDAKWEGREEGQEQLGQLISILFDTGRLEDAKLAASDPQARAVLLKEFGLDK